MCKNDAREEKLKIVYIMSAVELNLIIPNCIKLEIIN